MRLEKGYVQNDFVCFNIFCCIFADATLSTTESGHDLEFHFCKTSERKDTLFIKPFFEFFSIAVSDPTLGRRHVATFGILVSFLPPHFLPNTSGSSF